MLEHPDHGRLGQVGQCAAGETFEILVFASHFVVTKHVLYVILYVRGTLSMVTNDA